jgi:hypothetical protein
MKVYLIKVTNKVYSNGQYRLLSDILGYAHSDRKAAKFIKSLTSAYSTYPVNSDRYPKFDIIPVNEIG